ncbi:MAG: hypothetical protein EXQ87_01950 [Alphaproteobacteria bacterium]|nr:hypothetical protein [Alphaproteobacteria bacterium]
MTTTTTLDRPMRTLRHAWFNSPLYGMVLAGKTPASLLLSLRDLWPGDALRGEDLIRDGARVGDIFEPSLALSGEVDPAWLAARHGFAWLRDLKALGGYTARDQARVAVAAWLDRNEQWSELAWRPDVIGNRLVAWLSHYDLIANGDSGFRARLLTSLTRQARHLARALRAVPPGAGRMAAIHGLIAVGAALPAGHRWLTRGMAELAGELATQFLPDGGHAARGPAPHLAALRHLIDMRTIILGTARECSEAHQAAIAAGGALRHVRHGDGGLALFNDSGEDEGWAIDLVLAQAEPKGKPPDMVPAMGFERLAAGDTLVIVDAAPPPAAGFDGHAHAGTLAFEMSVGPDRLIVNCGAYAGPKTGWRAAQRATAAHSTISIEDRNSSEVLPGGNLGRRPESVGRARNENEQGVWLNLDHDGYLAAFGITHRRRLFLAHDGRDLRGEDTLSGGGGERRFAVRFHLHPKVRVGLTEDGAAVLLRLAGGAGWCMRVTGGRMSLAESVYLGGGEMAERSRQIVVEGTTGALGATVKWAIQSVGRGL